MIAIAIETIDENILEFAAVNENMVLFHCFGAGINELGWTFATWLGYNHYDIVAVDFHNIRPFLLKVPHFPAWNRRVLDLESLYFDGVKVPRFIDIAHKRTTFNGARGIAQVIMKAFLEKKKELLS